MRIRRLHCLLLLAPIVIWAQTALAADIAHSFNWTGSYAGLHVGYGWGNGDTNFSAPDPGFGDLAPTTLSPNPDGVVGGLQAGYNYQVGCFVFGIEADFSGSAMSGNTTSSPILDQTGTPLPNTRLTAGESINWYGTLRPRAGYAVTPSTLVYATGGLAYGNVSYSAYTDYRPILGSLYPSSFSSTKVGWAVGGGIEYAFAGCWTVVVQHLHIDLGDQSIVAAGIPQTGFQVGYKWQTTADIVSVGVNYKF